MRDVLAGLTRILTAGLVLLLLVRVFTDGFTLNIGSLSLAYYSIRLPLYALTGLALGYAFLHRKTFLSGHPCHMDKETKTLAADRCNLALVVLVVAGFILRIARIHEYGLTLDEASFVWVASADSLADVWRLVSIRSPHPPGYVFLLHELLKVSRDIFWLRLPSVLAGTYLIWISYRFTRELFGRMAGLSAAGLVALSPALLDMSRVVRNYTIGLAFLVTALLFLILFMRREQWRYFALFSLFAPLATIWSYSFLIVFSATGFTTVLVFIRRRYPVVSWIRAAACQIPFAAMVGFLYVKHIARLSSFTIKFHEDLYRSSLSLSPGNLLDPITQVWNYLQPQPFGEVLLGLSLLGIVLLLINGRRLELTLCLLPILAAYGFMWAGRYPLGGSRHSIYLFPFLFGLAVSPLSEIAHGFRETRANLRGIGKRHTRRPSPSSPGCLLILIAALLYVNISLSSYTRVRHWLFDGRFYELATYYRQEDVERAFSLLEERAGKNDLILLSVEGLYAFRLHMNMSPILDPTPEQERVRDLRIDFGMARETSSYMHRGVRYFFSNQIGLSASPTSVAKAFSAVTSPGDLGKVEKVWVVRGAWEFPLTGRFRSEFPEASVDLKAHRDSNGLLFAVDARDLEKIAAGLR